MIPVYWFTGLRRKDFNDLIIRTIKQNITIMFYQSSFKFVQHLYKDVPVTFNYAFYNKELAQNFTKTFMT